jgi:hypothetical protein
MKSLTNVLNTENLTPKERILLLAKNDISLELENKEILTKADILAITSWKAKNSYEASEYNKYLNAWETYHSLTIDAQTQYLNSQVAFLQAFKIIEMAMWMPFSKFKKVIDNIMEDNKDIALNNLLENCGIEYDHLIHKMTLESLSPELKSNLIALSPDFEIDDSYFIEEEVLYNIIKVGDELSQDEVSTIAYKILDSIKWNFVELLQKKDGYISEYIFGSYFAGLPMIKVLHKWAEFTETKYTNDEDLKIIFSKQDNIRNVLYVTLTRWIQSGLFINEFTPLFMSSDTETCNSVNTTKPHNEIFLEWLHIKNTQKQIIDEYIGSGKLEYQQRIKSINNHTLTDNLITGKSIYNLRTDNNFVAEFRSSIDQYVYIAYIIEFMKNQGFMERCQKLLGFQPLFKNVASIYEVDTEKNLNEYVEQLQADFKILRASLHCINDTISEELYVHLDSKYIIEVYIDDMIDGKYLDNPIISDVTERYQSEFKRILGGEWK